MRLVSGVKMKFKKVDVNRFEREDGKIGFQMDTTMNRRWRVRRFDFDETGICDYPKIISENILERNDALKQMRKMMKEAEEER